MLGQISHHGGHTRQPHLSQERIPMAIISTRDDRIHPNHPGIPTLHTAIWKHSIDETNLLKIPRTTHRNGARRFTMREVQYVHTSGHSGDLQLNVNSRGPCADRQPPSFRKTICAPVHAHAHKWTNDAKWPNKSTDTTDWKSNGTPAYETLVCAGPTIFP